MEKLLQYRVQALQISLIKLAKYGLLVSDALRGSKTKLRGVTHLESELWMLGRDDMSAFVTKCR